MLSYCHSPESSCGGGLARRGSTAPRSCPMHRVHDSYRCHDDELLHGVPVNWISICSAHLHVVMNSGLPGKEGSGDEVRLLPELLSPRRARRAHHRRRGLDMWCGDSRRRFPRSHYLCSADLVYCGRKGISHSAQTAADDRVALAIGILFR